MLPSIQSATDFLLIARLTLANERANKLLISNRQVLLTVRGVLTGSWTELWARAENPKLNMVKTGCEGDLTSVMIII